MLGLKACTAETLPVKAPKKARKREDKTVFLLLQDGKTALRKRPDTGLLAGLWEFPNVDGALDEAAAPLAVEAWGLTARAWIAKRNAKHIFSHVEWHMTCYIIQCRSKNALFVWADKENLQRTIALPTAFRQFCK